MKIGVSIIAYNEEDWIRGTLNSFKDVDKKIVLISEKPWHGELHEPDNTDKIAKDCGATVIKGDWRTEHEQRNFGLDYLKGMDYVWCIDGDELYDWEQIQAVHKYIEENQSDYYHCRDVKTYWKTPDYEVYPQDDHTPVVIARPKSRFVEHRNIGADGHCLPKNLLTMYHMSYVHSDKKIKQKLNNFSHSSEVKARWFTEKWERWFENMRCLHPYNINKWEKAIKKPCPDKIKKLNRQICQSKEI